MGRHRLHADLCRTDAGVRPGGRHARPSPRVLVRHRLQRRRLPAAAPRRRPCVAAGGARGTGSWRSAGIVMRAGARHRAVSGIAAQPHPRHLHDGFRCGLGGGIAARRRAGAAFRLAVGVLVPRARCRSRHSCSPGDCPRRRAAARASVSTPPAPCCWCWRPARCCSASIACTRAACAPPFLWLFVRCGERVGFILRERRAAFPIIDLRYFRDVDFSLLNAGHVAGQPGGVFGAAAGAVLSRSRRRPGGAAGGRDAGGGEPRHGAGGTGRGPAGGTHRHRGAWRWQERGATALGQVLIGTAGAAPGLLAVRRLDVPARQRIGIVPGGLFRDRHRDAAARERGVAGSLVMMTRTHGDRDRRDGADAGIPDAACRGRVMAARATRRRSWPASRACSGLPRCCPSLVAVGCAVAGLGTWPRSLWRNGV